MDHQPFLPAAQTPLRLPLYLERLHAGFPSPAEDYIEKKLDLNDHLISNPPATFFLRVTGDSMRDACIGDGDLLIVDSSRRPHSGAIVVAALDGELALKRYVNRRGTIFLIAENADYAPIEIVESADLLIWGVVTHVIHSTF